MKENRKYLYLIVTDYPYGIGEPFLETELFIIAEHFKKIYLIIPESHRVDHSLSRFKLPHNAELIELKISAGKSDKILALSQSFDEINRLERQYINTSYHQKFNVFHLKTLIGFRSMANRFEVEFKAILKKHNHPVSEVILYTYWFYYVTAALAKIKKDSPEYRVVTRIHGWDCFFERSVGSYLPLRPWVAKQIDGIFAISEAGRQYTINKLPGIEKNKIRRSYLGIDALLIPEIKVSSTNTLHIVSLAFIDPVKRLDRIIEALELIEDVQVQWTHIGNALDGNVQLQELAKQRLGRKSNISFSFKGEFTKQQVFSFFNSQHPDLLICTSSSEGLPVSMMEAMGHGIGVLSVDVGGVSEIVKHQFNGILLPTDASAVEIAQSLENWAGLTENERIDRGKNAYQIYNEYFSAPKNYLNFLEEALQG
jgi:glycosyltransferase involved in cell wall biosynthesis